MKGIFKKDHSTSTSSILNASNKSISVDNTSKFKNNLVKLYNDVLNKNTYSKDLLLSPRKVESHNKLSRINNCKIDLFFKKEENNQKDISLLANKNKSLYFSKPQNQVIPQADDFSKEHSTNKNNKELIKKGIYQLLQSESEHEQRANLTQRKKFNYKTSLNSPEKKFNNLLSKKENSKPINENTVRVNKMKNVLVRTLKQEMSLDQEFYRSKNKVNKKEVFYGHAIKKNPLLSSGKGLRTNKMNFSLNGEDSDEFFANSPRNFGSKVETPLQGVASLVSMRLNFLKVNSDIDSRINVNQVLLSPRVNFNNFEHSSKSHRRIKSGI